MQYEKYVAWFRIRGVGRMCYACEHFSTWDELERYFRLRFITPDRIVGVDNEGMLHEI